MALNPNCGSCYYSTVMLTSKQGTVSWLQSSGVCLNKKQNCYIVKLDYHRVRTNQHARNPPGKGGEQHEKSPLHIHLP